MSLKAKIEAVLFMTDKPIKAPAIARIINADVQQVRQALLELIHDYEERPGGLEISDEGGYAFQVKEEFASMMDEFAPVEMSAALLRTLSAIAIKQPVAQSEIIRVRGAGAYEHIRELVNRELIAKKDDGRSPILTTTKKFQEYFRLTRDGKDLRSFLRKQVKELEQATPAADTAGDASRHLALPVMAEESAAQTSDKQLNERIYLELSEEESAADPAEISVAPASAVAAPKAETGSAGDTTSADKPALEETVVPSTAATAPKAETGSAGDTTSADKPALEETVAPTPAATAPKAETGSASYTTFADKPSLEETVAPTPAATAPKAETGSAGDTTSGDKPSLEETVAPPVAIDPAELFRRTNTLARATTQLLGTDRPRRKSAAAAVNQTSFAPDASDNDDGTFDASPPAVVIDRANS